MRSQGFIAFVLVLCASAAWGAPKPDARDQAKAHYKAGERHQGAGEYEKAIDEYLAAYELAPLPVLLFNVGQAYRLKGDKAKALEYYQRYLLADPESKLKEDALGHVARLTQAIEEERRKRAARTAAPPPAEAPETPAATQLQPLKPEVQPPPRITEPAKVKVEPPKPAALIDERQGGGTLRLAGIITGGAGVASIAGGVFFGLRAKSIANDVATRYEPGKASDGEAANRMMFILYGVGAATLATGGILYYLGMQSDSEAARVTVSPMVTPDGAAVTVHGVF